MVSSVEASASRLTARHWWSFLALADHGRPERAAAWLGLSAATVLGHGREVERWCGKPLFHRLPGGMLLTEAGYRHRARIGCLLGRAELALRHAQHWDGTPPLLLPVHLPSGLPGAAPGRALAMLAARLAAEQAHTGLVPVTAEATAALTIRYGASGSVRDRWLRLRLKGRSNAAPPRILIPLLPTPMRDLAAARIRAMGRGALAVDLSPASLLAGAEALPEFEMLMPAGLLESRALPDVIEVIPEPCGEADPWLRVEGPDQPALVAALATHLGDALGPAPPAVPPPGEAFSTKHARSLLVLNEERNVGRAAARLCIVQPALTIQLRQIEGLVGRSLFERTPRGLVPGPVAQSLHALLGPVVEETALPPAASPRPIRIGLITQLDDETIVTTGVAEALRSFQAEYEGKGLQVLEGLSADLISQLREGRLDLAVVNQHLVQPGLEHEVLVEDHMVAVTDARRRLLPPGPVTLATLLRLPLVLPSGRHALRALMDGHAAGSGPEAGPRMEVDSPAMALRLVGTGLFATILPIGTIGPGAERRHLALHPVIEPRMTRRICAVGRLGEASGSRDFMAHLRRAFATLNARPSAFPPGRPAEA